MTYIIGIDLGTSNCALSYFKQSELNDSSSDAAELKVLDVWQQEDASSRMHRKTLPSFLLRAANTDSVLPWNPSEFDKKFIVGEFAKLEASEKPHLAIASAKSWLCHMGVDRNAAILPLHAESDKISPKEALAVFLRHLKSAFLHESEAEETEFNRSEVIVTVPASFDEVAKSLVHEAASLASFPEIRLLEEPQAAFYSWLCKHDQNWREQVSPSELILVCDIGGGTTDFSLITVTDEQGNLGLERLAVGDHLLLGGDNMDLTLAHLMVQKFDEEGHDIDEAQFASLVHMARLAKERILSDADVESMPISIVGKGSSLFASNLNTVLSREEVEQVLLEGFFPLVSTEELPSKNVQGLAELGLQYESDPAISKHLVAFLQKAKRSLDSLKAENPEKYQGIKIDASGNCLLPTAILFNGGVFQSNVLQERVEELVKTWTSGTLKILTGSNLDLAVCDGASRYGKIRFQGQGIRIKAGLSRSYYLGLQSTAPAIPGIKPKLKAICVAPQGSEEGSEFTLESNRFGLVGGEKIEFRFFSSNERPGDQMGSIVGNAEKMLEETASITVDLNTEKSGIMVPVYLESAVNDVGSLELAMKQTDSEHKWQLEFDLRAYDDK